MIQNNQEDDWMVVISNSVFNENLDFPWEKIGYFSSRMILFC